MVSVYYLMQQMRHNGAREPIYRHDSVVDFLKESRSLYDGPNRIGCRDGVLSLPGSIVTDRGTASIDQKNIDLEISGCDHDMSRTKDKRL